MLEIFLSKAAFSCKIEDLFLILTSLSSKGF